MNILKRLFFIYLLLGMKSMLLAYPSTGTTNSYYDSPSYSTTTGYASMGIAGNYIVYTSSLNHAPLAVLGSTQGFRLTGNAYISGSLRLSDGTTVSIRLNNLDSSTSTLQASINSFTGSTNALSARIDAISNSTTTFNLLLATVNTRLDNLDSSTSSIINHLLYLDYSTATLTTRLNNLDSSTQSLRLIIDTHTQRLDNLAVSTTGISNSFLYVYYSTALLTTRLNNLDSSTQSLRLIIDTHTQRLDNLAISTTGIATSFSYVYYSTALLTTRLNNLDSSTQSLKLIIDTHTTRLDNLDISTDSLRINLASSTIYATTRLDNLDTSTASITSRVVALEIATVAISARIDTLQPSYISNQINNLAISTTILTQRVNNLDSSTLTLQSTIYSTYSMITSSYVLAINSTFTQLTSNYISVVASTHSALITAINSTMTQTYLMINSTNNAIRSILDFVAIDTTTLKDRIDYISIDTATLKTRLDNVAIDTTTLKSRSDNFDIYRATSDQKVESWVLSQSTISRKINGYDLFVSSFEITSANISSLTVKGTVTSTSGFIGGNSTFSRINMTDGTWFISTSAFSGSGGTGASTQPVLTSVYLSTVGTDTNSFLITAKLSLNGAVLSFSSVCSLSKLGAGGLDTGTESASTWYQAHLRWNGSTFTVVASSASNDISTPVGTFDYNIPTKAFIYNDLSANIIAIEKKGKIVTFKTPRSLASSIDPNATKVKIPLENYISPNATKLFLNVNSADNSGAGTAIGINILAEGCNELNYASYGFSSGVNATFRTTSEIYVFKTFMDLPLCGDRALNYFESAGSQSNTSSIGLLGYEEE